MSLSLRSVVKFTLLHFPVSCWLEMGYITWWTVVGSFLTILSIQTFILFLAGNTWFHGLLFFDWEIYYMLWCSQYCDKIQMGVPLGEKLTLTSNISYLMKVWSERSVFNVGRVEVFVPSVISEPGDHPLLILLLRSSKISDEQYLRFLVCGSHHFIVALMFV